MIKDIETEKNKTKTNKKRKQNKTETLSEHWCSEMSVVYYYSLTHGLLIDFILCFKNIQSQ